MMEEKTGQLLNYAIITHDLPPSAKTILLGWLNQSRQDQRLLETQTVYKILV